MYVGGWTGSTNNIASNGFQNTIGGSTDAFLAKFDSDGVLIWGTYYGGSSFDRGRSCITDRSGNVYLAGFTESTSNVAFNGHQNTHGGGWDDAFLVKFDSNGSRLWATYYGGSNEDLGWICAVDDSNSVYLCGMSTSTNNISYGGHQMNFGGGADDAFLVKFDSTGQRRWGTYYGGTSLDRGWACGTAGADYVYLSGSTQSASDISLSGHQNTIGGAEDGFLVKFDANGFIDHASVETLNDDNFLLFPNPSTGNFTVKFKKSGEKEVFVYNSLGAIVYHKTTGAPEENINLEQLSQGVYYIEVHGNDTSTVKKVALQR